MPKDHGKGGNPFGHPGHRQPTVIEVVDWQRRMQEFWEARMERLNSKPRMIRNPVAASSLSFVIDQIPRVKSELNDR